MPLPERRLRLGAMSGFGEAFTVEEKEAPVVDLLFFAVCRIHFHGIFGLGWRAN